jgi:hypothetical protein
MSMNTAYPTLNVLWNLSNSAVEFDKFKENASGYLTSHGVAFDPSPKSTYQILTSVARGGQLDKAGVEQLASNIISEAQPGADGPLAAGGGPDSQPFTPLYNKYVLGQSIAWGAYPDLEGALVTQLSAPPPLIW